MIKVAVLYKTGNPFMHGHHYNNNIWRFLIDDLPKNSRVTTKNFVYDKTFDCRKLKDFDIILPVTYPQGQLEDSDLLYLEDIKAPKITVPPDCHLMTPEWVTKCKKYGIRTAFWEHAPEWFKLRGPKNSGINYHQIIMGVIDPRFYVTNDWNKRIANKLMTSGDCGGDYPKTRIWRKYYMLRRHCRDLPCVDYFGRIKPSVCTANQRPINEQYPVMLQSYRAAIAASTKYTVSKFVEHPAAGCLSFMEASDINNFEHLGFVDRETAVFIRDWDYKEVIAEYLQTVNDPKWAKIALAGRQHVLDNFRSEVQVNKVVNIMESLL